MMTSQVGTPLAVKAEYLETSALAMTHALSTHMDLSRDWKMSRGLTGEPDPECLRARHMSTYTQADCQVPQTRRQQKKTNSRAMPLYHCARLPVMLTLSRNQWMFRNGLESSYKIKVGE